MANQSVDINKINWKKVNDSLAQSGLKTSEINILNSLFSSIIEAHTNLGDLIFMRQYMFSVFIRLHNYLKESNMIQNPENLRDIYDYVLSSILLAVEMSANYSFDAGVSFLITKIMNKIFNIENTNSALVVLDSRFSLKQKYVIEPIISNKSSKISLEKAKEYVNFIFNLFSYCDSATHCVSISVLCSSLWISNFKGMPYTVDDYIIPDFSTNPNNNSMFNSLLLARRDYILSFFNGEGGSIDLGDYSFKEFIKAEPDELYDDLKKLQENLMLDEDDEELDEDEIDLIENREIADAMLSNFDDESPLTFAAENEIKMFDAQLTDLNCAVNGSLPKSNVSTSVMSGNTDESSVFPRLRKLLSYGSSENITIKEVIDSLNDYEKELCHKKRHNVRKEDIIKGINEALEEIKQEKQRNENLLNSIKTLPDEYYEKFLGEPTAGMKETMDWMDFVSYIQENIDILKKSDTRPDEKMLMQMISAYNKIHKSNIIFKNIRDVSGVLTFDHTKGKKIIDTCTIKDWKLTCTPCIVEEKRKLTTQKGEKKK